MMWYAPGLVDNKIRKEHEKITGSDSVNMSLVKRYVKEQRNGIILIPVYNTELYEIDNQYISVAVNGQTGKTIGELPIDNGKLIRTFLLIFIPILLVLLALFYFVF